MSVWDDNETEVEPEKLKSKRDKKDKDLSIDHKSLGTAKFKIEKLRPLKDRIVLKVKHVKGFAGCLISDKIKVLCINEDARKEIRRILNRYTLVEIINVNIQREKNIAPAKKMVGAAFASRRSRQINQEMIELRRKKL